MAVAIVIHPRATRTPALAGMQQPRFFCHIAESTIPIVAIQSVLRPAGNKEVLETIVVIIPNRDTAGPTLAGESCFCSHVSKSAITVVLVKPVTRIFDWPRTAG